MVPGCSSDTPANPKRERALRLVACRQRCIVPIVCFLASILALSHIFLCAVFGQIASQPPASQSLLEHYELAQRAQTAGDLRHAEFEYQLFLADALHRLANGRANARDFVQALPWFEEALRLAPHDERCAWTTGERRLPPETCCRPSGWLVWQWITIREAQKLTFC